MAEATLTPQRPKPQINTFALGPFEIATGPLDVSAATDTYATGGVLINWPYPLKTPLFAIVWGSVTKTIGYVFDLLTGRLRVYTTLACTTEKTAAQAMNNTVDVVTDVPYFFGIFKKS